MKKVFISSGHDSGDPGAVKYVVERDEVWDIANRIANVLNKKYDIKAYRDAWTDGWRDTVNKANKYDCDFFFEFHENAGGGKGAECIIYNKDNQYLADEIKKAFVEIGQNWRRTIIDPTFWVLKYTNMPAMIIECAFVDNYEDIKNWNTAQTRQKMAESLAKHIAKICGVKEKSKNMWKKETRTVWWYEREDKTYPKNQWEKIDGKWYYFDEEGYMKTGWLKNKNNHYWLSPSDGHMMTGWQKIEHKWYYFHADGHMAANEKTPDGYKVNIDGVWIK